MNWLNFILYYGPLVF